MEVTRLSAVVTCESLSREEVEGKVNTYKDLFNETQGGNSEKRKKNYEVLVNGFYNLVTTFYEFGWGPCFHFAPRFKGEGFEASLARHEMYLASHLKLEKGMKVIDLGCGVGGPARCIARFSEVSVLGLNNNAYQVTRAKQLTENARLGNQVSFVKGDFMNIPFPEQTYDAAYSIEATIHAPDKVGVYSEIFRVLKPGALYGSYEWVMTNKYDESNQEHVRIRKGIEVGNGLPELKTPQHLLDALKEVGFEVLEFRDIARNSDEETPWYLPIEGSYSFMGFKHTWIGSLISHYSLSTLEMIKVTPTGTTEVSDILMATAEDLVKGGKLDIFTPAFFFVARKPLSK